MSSPSGMLKHWFIHMVRVQVLSVILSVAVFLGFAAITFNTDMNHVVDLRRVVSIRVFLDQRIFTYPTKWATNSRALILRIPVLSQFPELPNGCEVTSLAMLLNELNVPSTKLDLARLVHKDLTPLDLSVNGNFVRWGNPNVGFVGSIYGNVPGYGVYHHPIAELLNQLIRGQALDLTGSPFSKVLSEVASGRPVVVWVTLTFTPVHNWVKWQSPEGPVRATLDEHTVLLVGFDKNHVYINNPWNGEQAEPVPLQNFKNSWVQMGRQAVTVKSMTPYNSQALHKLPSHFRTKI